MTRPSCFIRKLVNRKLDGSWEWTFAFFTRNRALADFTVSSARSSATQADALSGMAEVIRTHFSSGCRCSSRPGVRTEERRPRSASATHQSGGTKPPRGPRDTAPERGLPIAADGGSTTKRRGVPLVDAGVVPTAGGTPRSPADASFWT